LKDLDLTPISMEKSQFHTDFFMVLVLYKGFDISVLDQFFL